MNLIQFQKQVYERILSEYFKEVRKEKLTIKDKFLFPSIWGTCIFISCLANIFLKEPPVFVIALIFSVLFIFSLNFFCRVKDILMFKKESDKFFCTTFLKFPVLDSSELKQYFRSTDDFFCKRSPTHEEINNLVMLTPNEIKQMNDICFDNNQKKIIYEKITNDEKINFYFLKYLINKSEEKLKEIKKQEEDARFININIHKDLLNSLGYKVEISNCSELVKKTKYLL